MSSADDKIMRTSGRIKGNDCQIRSYEYLIRERTLNMLVSMILILMQNNVILGER